MLASPPRLRFLFSGGPSTFVSLLRFLRSVVPRASDTLREIEAHARTIPNETTRNEAIASAQAKAYHVAGACILATFLPREAARRYIDIVTPLETIYDYLDNLCDRHPDVDSRAYPVLHGALSDALNPDAPLRDYYAYGPDGGDGGYLAMLVRRTQDGLRALAHHEQLLRMFQEAATFYTDLQTFKHLPPGQREPACIAWYERNRERFEQMEWYEFAAATGSQWQVYVPLFMLLRGNPDASHQAYHAYFPDVAALHVLLDAFIDQTEDREHGELNLFECYGTQAAARRRMNFLARQAYAAFERMPDPVPHRFLLRIMALFYLTHPKVAQQGLEASSLRLLAVLDAPRRSDHTRAESAEHAPIR